MTDRHGKFSETERQELRNEQLEAEIVRLKSDRAASAQSFYALMERYDAQQAEIAALRHKNERLRDALNKTASDFTFYDEEGDYREVRRVHELILGIRAKALRGEEK
jgi:cell division protein FtsB